MREPGRQKDWRLEAESRLLVKDALAAPPRGPVLVIGSGSTFSEHPLVRRSAMFVEQLNDGSQGNWFRDVELPFQDDSFEAVVLMHKVANGSEPVVAEACRVLAPGGHLLILGLNRLGWKFQAQRRGVPRKQRLPGIAPIRVRNALVGLGMCTDWFSGCGLLGRGGTSEGSAMRIATRVFEPLADLVLIGARHEDEGAVTPLRFSTSTGRIQSAAMRG